MALQVQYYDLGCEECPFDDLFLASMIQQVQLKSSQLWEMGGGEGHHTSIGALGLHLLPSQMPIKIDCRGQWMALPGMLGPYCLLSAILHHSKDHSFPFECSKTLFMEESQVSLDSPWSPSLKCSIITWLNTYSKLCI